MTQDSMIKTSRLLALLGAAATAVAILLLFGQALAFAGSDPSLLLITADPQGGPVPTCFTTYGNLNTTQFATENATAVQNAVDAAAPGDVVKIAGFCAGLQTLFGVTQTVHISKDITLEGGYSEMDWAAEPNPDMYTTILDGTRNGRVVTISGTHAITLSHMTIQNGVVASSDNGGGVYNDASIVTIVNTILTTNEAGNGGAIYNDSGSIYLYNSVVKTNVAVTNGISWQRGGGGLFNDSGHVQIDQSQIMTNASEYNGGGIVNMGYLTLTNSLVSGNNGATLPTLREAATPQNIDNIGGGIANLYGDIWIENSTIRGNTTSGNGGGGLGHSGSSSFAFINNSTIEGNIANGGQGGGILFSQPMTITNSTISGNMADVGGGIYEDDGGLDAVAVFQYSTVTSNTANLNGNNMGLSNMSSVIVLMSSIIAGTGDNCYLPTGATIIDQGYNIESGTNCGLTMTTSLTNTNPLLLPLAANGGDTETHALAAASPALDMIPAGDNGCGSTITTDQRGEPRPSNDSCDSGSYETQPAVIVEYFIYLPTILKQD